MTKDHRYTIGDAECSNSHIATVSDKLIIHEDNHYAGTNIHQEWRNTNRNDVLNQVFFKTVYSSFKV